MTKRTEIKDVLSELKDNLPGRNDLLLSRQQPPCFLATHFDVMAFPL